MPTRRQLQIPRRSPREPEAEPVVPSLVAAEAEVRRVFGARPRPYTVHYCLCCFEPQEMAEGTLRYNPAQPVLQQTYLKDLLPHPDNVRTLARLVEPAAVAAHLWGYLREVERLESDLSTIDEALAWVRYPSATSGA